MKNDVPKAPHFIVRGRKLSDFTPEEIEKFPAYFQDLIFAAAAIWGLDIYDDPERQRKAARYVLTEARAALDRAEEHLKA